MRLQSCVHDLQDVDLQGQLIIFNDYSNTGKEKLQ